MKNEFLLEFIYGSPEIAVGFRAGFRWSDSAPTTGVKERRPRRIDLYSNWSDLVRAS